MYQDEDEEFLGSFCAFVGNGLLIFRDVNSTDTHADYRWDTVTHAVADSIYICVQHPVDGPVEVDLYEDDSPELSLDVAIFDGRIDSLQGQFVLHDPVEDVRLKITTDHPGSSRLRISGDEETRPARLRFQIWNVTQGA
ncbi:hypothetical protein [Plantactinospora sp. WMMB782]|uniref:hypothetical protein n=1 Tax=Plantactinospora sp. WMMB782 TaxID=3404121 RepID=UPI003B9586E1